MLEGIFNTCCTIENMAVLPSRHRQCKTCQRLFVDSVDKPYPGSAATYSQAVRNNVEIQDREKVRIHHEKLQRNMRWAGGFGIGTLILGILLALWRLNF